MVSCVKMGNQHAETDASYNMMYNIFEAARAPLILRLKAPSRRCHHLLGPGNAPLERIVLVNVG